MTAIPFETTPDFEQRIAGAFGETGIEWLENLPDILSACAERWRLTVSPPFELSYNYVAPATSADGTPVVLKISPPNPDFAREAHALRLFAGRNACALLEYSPGDGAMLLERVAPGEPLTRIAMHDDEYATSIFIDMLQQLWRPAPEEHGFLSVADRARYIEMYRAHFDGGSGPLPERLLAGAEETFDWLLSTSNTSLLLHGDLHHDNILSATRVPWLVIDPKGVVGDPGYDLGAFLYNPIPGLLAMPDPKRAIARRVDQLAEGLDMERARVRGWGFGQAMLSACWSVDDRLDPDHALTCAMHLAALKV